MNGFWNLLVWEFSNRKYSPFLLESELKVQLLYLPRPFSVEQTFLQNIISCWQRKLLCWCWKFKQTNKQNTQLKWEYWNIILKWGLGLPGTGVPGGALGFFPPTLLVAQVADCTLGGSDFLSGSVSSQAVTRLWGGWPCTQAPGIQCRAGHSAWRSTLHIAYKRECLRLWNHTLASTLLSFLFNVSSILEVPSVSILLFLFLTWWFKCNNFLGVKLPFPSPEAPLRYKLSWIYERRSWYGRKDAHHMGRKGAAHSMCFRTILTETILILITSHFSNSNK